MSENKKRNTLGRIVVTAFLLFTVPVCSVAAKDTDIVLHSIFLDNVEFVDINDLGTEENGKFQETVTKQIEEITYIGNIKNSTRILEEEEEMVEPRHTHNKVKSQIQGHKKYSDGSCKVTVYNANYCEGCDTYWKTGIVDSFEYKKCSH